MNQSSRDDNQRAHAEGLLGLALTAKPPAGQCPSPEQIASWHEGVVDADSASSVEAHVADCDNCYALWTGLMAAEALEPAPAPTRQSASASWLDWIGSIMPARAVAAGLVAVAAGGVLFSVLTSQPPLPSYGLSLEGRTQVVRGEADSAGQVAVFDDGNRFQLKLTPDTAVDGEVSVRIFIATQQGIQQLPVPTAGISSKGVVLIEGVVGADVPLPEGKADLLVVVGRESDFPSAATLHQRLRDASSIQTRDWTAWKIPVRVEQ